MVFVLMRPDLTVTTQWLILDPPGRIVLLVVSTLFLFCSFYTVGYLQYRKERSNRVFCALPCLGFWEL
jgi:hydrogenase-4 component F